MNETIVDARGFTCPKPLIMTKTALTKLEINQKMIVIIDNETSKQNVERFLKDNGATSSCTESAGVFTLSVLKNRADLPRPSAEAYCIPQASSPPQANRENALAPVILFKNDKMGCGPDELGSILIKAFINTIKEISPQPSALVFYNNGIHLAVEESPVIAPLQDLEKRGISILVCGTCLDYFNKKAFLKVGTVSNMYTILETLSNAHHVITP
jgi:selenium metabolism protein YedF